MPAAPCRRARPSVPPGERRDFPAGDGEGFVGSRKSLALSRRAEIQGWRRLDERPDRHALPPAPLAVGYLCVPADAQFIKALMRGILPAFWAKAVEPFAPVALTNCAAPGELGHEGPNSERRKSMPPGLEARRAVTTHTPLDRDEAKSVKEIAERDRVAGMDDHRFLLHGIGSACINHASRI